MSFSKIFDRFWWSSLITIFLGLIWLRFLNPVVPCLNIGLIICISCGFFYFITGIRDMKKQQRYEEEIERRAYEELINNSLEGDA